MALIGIGVYLFIRFGLTNMIRKYTVHRGMFHSIPAGLIFAGVAFLVCGGSMDLHIRYFKAGAVFAGFMSHLILDEIYSVEWKGGMWRLKKSSGTAVKLWGDDSWSNFTTYAKLLLVGGIIMGEPSVMQADRIAEPRTRPTLPGAAEQLPGLVGQHGPHDGDPTATGRGVAGRAGASLEPVQQSVRSVGPSGFAGRNSVGLAAGPAWPSFPAPHSHSSRNRRTRSASRRRKLAACTNARQRLRHSATARCGRGSSSRRSQVGRIDPERHRAVVHQRRLASWLGTRRSPLRRPNRGPARRTRRRFAPRCSGGAASVKLGRRPLRASP